MWKSRKDFRHKMTWGPSSLMIIFIFRIVLAFSNLSTKELKDRLWAAFANVAFPWTTQGARQTLLRLWHLWVERSSTYNSHKYFWVLKIQFQQIFTYTVFSTPTQVPIKCNEQNIPGKEKFTQKETSLAWLKPSNLAVEYIIVEGIFHNVCPATIKRSNVYHYVMCVVYLPSWYL